jgi:hypothetical protein
VLSAGPSAEEPEAGALVTNIVREMGCFEQCPGQARMRGLDGHRPGTLSPKTKLDAELVEMFESCRHWGGSVSQESPRVRRRAPLEENLGGRAAIQRTELLWRNEASDPLAREGELSSPRASVSSAGFAAYSTGALRARAVQRPSSAR